MDVETGLVDNNVSEAHSQEIEIILNEGLIACVKEMPILWNELHVSASDRTEVELITSWTAVAADLGLSVTDVQVRWKKLCDGYVAARQSVNASTISKGSDCARHEDQIVVNFPYYDLMSFLGDYLDQIGLSARRETSHHGITSGAHYSSDKTAGSIIDNKSPASFEMDVLNFLGKNAESGHMESANNKICEPSERYLLNFHKKNSSSDQIDLRDFLLSIEDAIKQVPEQHRVRVQKEMLQFLESKLHQLKT